MKKNRLVFPKNFLWGSAVSALQTEGNGITKRGKHVWDLFYEKDPNFFYKNVGPSKTSDAMRYYKEDLRNLATHGHNSFRSGFSWSRLFPDGKNVDLAAVKYYHDFLDYALSLKLKTIMSLQHFDMPLFCQKKGGFLNDNYPKEFEKYADFIFNEYKDKVNIFVTCNEPVVPIIAGYLSKSHWPRINNPKKALKAGINEVIAHGRAVKIFNTKYRKITISKISVICNVSPFIPTDGKTYSKKDMNAAEKMNFLHNFAIMDPMIIGKITKDHKDLIKQIDKNLKISSEDIKIIKEIKLDCVGVNFYAPARVMAPTKKSKNFFENYAIKYQWPKARMNIFRGWEIFPQMIESVAEIVKTRYKNMPFWISENGMGVQNEYLYKNKSGIIQDDYRIAFVNEHLEHLHKAIKNGANCFGYHMWASYDCWSMGNAYKNTYGFFEVDLKTFKRTPKKSAIWFKDVYKNNGINKNYKKFEETIDLSKIKTVPSVS